MNFIKDFHVLLLLLLLLLFVTTLNSKQITII